MWPFCWMRWCCNFVWEIKCWDLRTLSNVNVIFLLMKWIKKTYLWCIPLCFGVCLSFYCFFLALLHNHCYSLHKTKSRLVTSIRQGPSPVATKMPFFSPKLKSAANFSSSNPRGKPPFPYQIEPFVLDFEARLAFVQCLWPLLCLPINLHYDN